MDIDELISDRDKHKDESERWQKLYQSEIRISSGIHSRLVAANAENARLQSIIDEANAQGDQLREQLEIAGDKLANAEIVIQSFADQKPAYKIDYQYGDDEEDPDPEYAGDLVFYALDGKDYERGTLFYARPIPAQQSVDRNTIINVLLSIGNMSEGIIADAIISAIGEQSPAVAVPDNCEVCKGMKGGVRGNENVINGIRVCDYCSADESYKNYAQSPRITERSTGDYITGEHYELGLWSRRNIEAFIADGNTVNGTRITAQEQAMMSRIDGSTPVISPRLFVSDTPAPDNCSVYFFKRDQDETN